MTSIQEIQDGARANGGQQRLVEFRFYRKDAGMVWVVGEFTQWQGGRLAMDRREDGWWVLTVPLAPGDYRFRYLADEAGREVWFTDFASHGVEYADGQWNSVVAVPRRVAAAATKRMERETKTMTTKHAEPLAA